MPVGWDVETHPIRKGQIYPKLVCLSYALDDGSVGVLDRRDGVDWFREALRSYPLIVAHEQRFDLGVIAAEDRRLMPLIFQALADGQLRCTSVRQLLLDVCDGHCDFRRYLHPITGERVVEKSGYHLVDLLRRWTGRERVKDGSGDAYWRVRYALLEKIPVIDWPEPAKRYSIDDSVDARDVWIAQEASLEGDEIPDEVKQNCDNVGLGYVGGYGNRTDAPYVDALRESLETEIAAAHKALASTGLIKPKAASKGGGWSKHMAAIYARVRASYERLGVTCPETKTGRVGTDEDTLTGTGDADLIRLGNVGHAVKIRSTYVPSLEQGKFVPITPRYKPMRRTGRSSCEHPNWQNPPRFSHVEGGLSVRDSVIPRDGFVFAFVDYSTIELVALAQVHLILFGQSALADALNAGMDLHTLLAADLDGRTYEEELALIQAGDKAAKKSRQLSKIANFGFAGGMGWRAFIDYARGYGVILTDEMSQRLRETFMARWIEMQWYFDHVSSLVGGGGATIKLFGNGLVCGDKGYTDTCNIFFQGLAAAGAIGSVWELVRECYVGHGGFWPEAGPRSPLHGSRPNAFLHDENGAEIPYPTWSPRRFLAAHEAANRISAIMVESMTRYITDVPIKAPAVLTRRWYKGAEPVLVNGILVPSRPVEVDGKERWIADLTDAEIEEVQAIKLAA